MQKILLIDDDIEIQSIISAYFKREGFHVSCAATAADGMAQLASNTTSIIILDIFLKDGNGLELCKTIRQQSKIPILLISAKGDESDKVLGLGLGADDFMTKPFSMNELVARTKAHLRRDEYYESTLRDTGCSCFITIGPFSADIEARTIHFRGEPLELTGKEFDILLFFLQNPGKVFSSDALYTRIWGTDFVGENGTIMVYISRLRKKIERNPATPEMLLNVRGIGYKFIAGSGK